MKKLALTLVLLCFTFANAQKKNNRRIKESGVQTTQNRTTKTYDAINAGGSFKVVLVAGTEGTITITGDENIITHIVTEVKNNELHIYFEKNLSITYRSQIIVTVPVEAISGITFAGSGDVVSKTTLNATNFNVKLSGSGDVDIAVNATKVSATLAGSGDINISGKTTELEAKVVGSGDIDCGKLVSENATVTVSGSGDLKVNCTNNLTAAVAGSGTIKYKNKPATMNKTVAGSGEIIAY